MNLLNLGEKIKETRNNLGYSQEGFVSLLKPEISVKTLQRAEKGEEIVSKETYMQICEYLDIPFSKDKDVVVYEIDSLKDLTVNIKNMEIINPYRDSFDEEGLDLLIEMTDSMGRNFNNFKEELLFEKEMYSLKKRLDEAGINIFTRVRKGSEPKYVWSYTVENIFESFLIENNFEDAYESIYKTQEEYLENSKLKDLPAEYKDLSEKYPPRKRLDPVFFSQLELYIYKDDSKDIRKNKSGKKYIVVQNYDYSNCIDYLGNNVTKKVNEYLKENKEVKYRDKDGKLSMIKTTELNKVI